MVGPARRIRSVLGLSCLLCGKLYPAEEVDYVCPDHGGAATLSVAYDYEYLATLTSPEQICGDPDSSIWRYRHLLPVHPEADAPPLHVGGTPLLPARVLGEGLKVNLWVKDEGRQPTASLKDRASAMAILKAQEKGADIITAASTGNAGAALAALSAAAEIPSVIFVPATAPQPKVAQLLSFGATVALVNGSYHQAFDLCLWASEEYGWYNRNTGFNPYMTEGKKTVSYEIWEQLGSQVPDVVVVSVGDGSIIGGVHKGFSDLQKLGWTDRVPRLIGAQAAGSSYMVQAWKNAEDLMTKPPILADTVADSISADLPRDRFKAMAAVTDTGGAFVEVSDSQILSAMVTMGQRMGVFAEPAAAAAMAGLRVARWEGLVEEGERVVVISTGNGLKDIDAAMRAVTESGEGPLMVDPEIEALADRLAAHFLDT
ncbi:MAG: threonine synthase [bacterium]|nr:threonine synthase [bacterium]